MAVEICRTRNSIIDHKHPDALAFNTFPVATFAMMSVLPMLVVVDTAAVGILLTIERMVAGGVGKGLLILFLGTPFLGFVNLWICSLIAVGIDGLVLLLAPDAPTNIFPTARG